MIKLSWICVEIKVNFAEKNYMLHILKFLNNDENSKEWAIYSSVLIFQINGMMASVESIITEEFLICSICFEVYKDPSTLSCLHSFCKDCIDNPTTKGHTKTHP